MEKLLQCAPISRYEFDSNTLTDVVLSAPANNRIIVSPDRIYWNGYAGEILYAPRAEDEVRCPEIELNQLVQIADVTCSALCIGLAGVLVAAATAGALSLPAAVLLSIGVFTLLFDRKHELAAPVAPPLHVLEQNGIRCGGIKPHVGERRIGQPFANLV